MTWLYNEDQTASITSDSAWWSNILPPGWKVIGFSYRDSAAIYKEGSHSCFRMSVQISGEFMCAMRGLDWEKEKGSRDY